MTRFEVLLASVIIALVANVSQAKPHWELSTDDQLVESFVKLMQTKFEWENCGDKNLPFKFNNLSLTPDPVAVPGSAKISFGASLARDVNEPVKIELQVQKKLGFWWIKLPCVKDVFGSCTYNDVCPLLQKVDCEGATCHCPFKQGTYILPTTVASIDDKMVPYDWLLVRGQYKVKAEVSDNQGPVACVNFQFTLA